MSWARGSSRPTTTCWDGTDVATVRIAVASTPLTTSLADAVPAAIAAVEEAGRLEAAIVCLPESGLPGHRVQSGLVADLAQDALDDALASVAAAARRGGGKRPGRPHRRRS